MYQNYKIVVNTDAGRRRYMQYLVPLIVSNDLVDRYDIWVNTYNGADIEFFKRLAEKFPKINLVWQPDGVVDGIKSINAFYKDCIDENTIYFKIDDDLLWMEPDGIKKMVEFRVEHPEYFLVSPLVINNSLSTYLLQMRNKIKLDMYYNSCSNHPILWESAHFAAQLHTWFMDNFLSTNKWDELHVGMQPMAMTRFSINAVLWFGKDLKKINGIIHGDDEEFMSSKYPTMIAKANCWNGNVIAAHFAFYPQRNYLDSQNFLERYGKIILDLYKGSNAEYASNVVQSILRDIDSRATELEPICDPYIRKLRPTQNLNKSSRCRIYLDIIKKKIAYALIGANKENKKFRFIK